MLGVVGLGGMGTAIAKRLDAEWTWNRTPPRSMKPADLARRCDVVIVMVSDAAAVAAVTEGEGGIAAGCTPGTTVVQMSTVSPDAIERLAGVLPEGVTLVDAPVHGGPAAVAAGEALVFLGGDAQGVRPLLERLGTVVATGDLGTAAAAKLVCNASLFGTLALLGEVLALGDRLGLDRDVAFATLDHTPLAAQAQRRRPAVERGEYPPRFALPLAVKDADLIHDVAALPTLEAARQWLHLAAHVDPERDYTAILREILQ